MRRRLNGPPGLGYNRVMGQLEYVLAFIAVFAASAAGTGLITGFLRQRAMFDLPNDRSSHASPTPRGGGLAVTAVLIIAWNVVTLTEPESPLPMSVLLIGAVLLAVVSWIDDLRSLHPAVRLAAHFAAAAVALPVLPEQALVFQGLLPLPADRLAAMFLLVWFINLFNFMDGIDGITGVEAVTVSAGCVLIGFLFPAGIVLPGFSLYGLVIAAAAMGFLCWNWEPARVFLGDVGSVPMGYLLGVLLLVLAASGLWAAALILPLYYFADSGATIVRRAIKGEKIWRPHASHYYQQAARRVGSHARVALAVLYADAVLVALALYAAEGNGVLALILAAVLTAALLYYLAVGAKP
jgi:UDP-N-acetylmuramyl pentapeptide phosphotransferase/UDP-N-acetylglucosamine-1-phosphate transferase